MELAVKTIGFNPAVMGINHRKRAYFATRLEFFKSGQIYLNVIPAQKNFSRDNSKALGIVLAASVIENTESSKNTSEDFMVAEKTFEGKELKISFEVSGAKTKAIFDDVFSKLVAAAQPIPGFRRLKGGKTPDIPKDVLLHIIGASKVKKQSIKKTIDSTVTEYVAKEELKVTKDLRVKQSLEELESTFEPGKDFCFGAILQIQEGDS